MNIDAIDCLNGAWIEYYIRVSIPVGAQHLADSPCSNRPRTVARRLLPAGYAKPLHVLGYKLDC